MFKSLLDGWGNWVSDKTVLEQETGMSGVLRLEGPPNINGSLGRVAVIDVVG